MNFEKKISDEIYIPPELIKSKENIMFFLDKNRDTVTLATAQLVLLEIALKISVYIGNYDKEMILQNIDRMKKTLDLGISDFFETEQYKTINNLKNIIEDVLNSFENEL